MYRQFGSSRTVPELSAAQSHRSHQNACRRACDHLARANVCVSHYLSQRLGLPHSVTIYNPVDQRAFLGGDLGPAKTAWWHLTGDLKTTSKV